MTEARAFAGDSSDLRERASGEGAPARASLRRRLAWLVVALALPAIGLSVAGILSAYRAERHATRALLRETTRSLAANVAGEIERAEAVLQTLALSTSLRERDHRRFYDKAKQASLIQGAPVALLEPGGRILLDTSLPFGTAGSVPCLDAVRRAVETRSTALSDLCGEPAEGDPRVFVTVPVLENEAAPFVLSLALAPDFFQKRIAEQRLPPDWIAVVADRGGRIVARSHAHRQFLGQEVRPELFRAAQAKSSGDIPSTTLEGVSVRAYFQRSPAHGYLFAIGYPAVAFSASLAKPMLWFILLAGAAVAGLVAAALLARSIIGPVDHLLASAAALGRGAAVRPKATGIAELDAVETALAAASDQLQRRQAERDRAERASRDSEARLRLALTAGRLGLWQFDAKAQELTASAVCKANFGRAPDEPFTYRDLLDAIHPEDRERQRLAVEEALAARADFSVEYRTIRPDGSLHWIEVRGTVLDGPGGAPVMVGVSQDVSESRMAEERQGLLLHELNHRVKNTLATVQAIASMTRRSGRDPEAMWAGFTARLQGLAKTNDLLAASNWDGAPLRETLVNELGPYDDGQGRRIGLQGEPVMLSPRAALALGLAVHELATNAAKYGALSVPEGTVRVAWSLVRTGEGPKLRIEWAESGGPAVQKPERQGFGSRLIQRGLAQQLGGEIELDFAPAGVRCLIVFPVQGAVVDDPASDQEAAPR